MSEARDSRFIADNQQQVERLAKLGWYHSIELPDGTVIPGHQSIEQLRTRVRQFHIPEDLTGKRALDIGARTYGSVRSILDNNLDRHPAQQRAADGVTILHPNIRGARYYH